MAERKQSVLQWRGDALFALGDDTGYRVTSLAGMFVWGLRAKDGKLHVRWVCLTRDRAMENTIKDFHRFIKRAIKRARDNAIAEPPE